MRRARVRPAVWALSSIRARLFSLDSFFSVGVCVLMFNPRKTRACWCVCFGSLLRVWKQVRQQQQASSRLQLGKKWESVCCDGFKPQNDFQWFSNYLSHRGNVISWDDYAHNNNIIYLLRFLPTGVNNGKLLSSFFILSEPYLAPALLSSIILAGLFVLLDSVIKLLHKRTQSNWITLWYSMWHAELQIWYTPQNFCLQTL